MALGLFLWVAWITVLLNSSADSKTDYRLSGPTQNLIDLADDFPSDNLDFDEGGLAEPEAKPADLVYASYNKPSVPKPVNLAPTGQSQSTPQSTPDVAQLVTGELRQWESKPFDPIVFPLSGSNQNLEPPKPKLPPFQSQSTPLSVYTISKPDAPAPSPPSDKKPVQLPSLMAISPPGLVSWQPATPPKIPGTQRVMADPLGSQYQNFNRPTGDGSSDKLNLLLERGYQYGSQDARPPVSLSYAPSPNAAEELGMVSAMKIPQSYSATRYGMDTTGFTSAPQKPSLNLPLVNIRPYEGFPYAGQHQDNKLYPESPAVYKLSPQKKPETPSANAMSLVFDVADRSSQDNQGKVSIEDPPLPKDPFFQSAVGIESSPKDWMAVPFSSIFGDGFQGFNQMADLSENSVFNMKGSFPQAYQMPPLKPLRKTFVIRTKNSYQRGRFLKSKTTYTPAYKMVKMSTTKSEPVQAPKADVKA